jgi:hypothetical protein
MEGRVLRKLVAKRLAMNLNGFVRSVCWVVLAGAMMAESSDGAAGRYSRVSL